MRVYSYYSFLYYSYFVVPLSIFLNVQLLYCYSLIKLAHDFI